MSPEIQRYWDRFTQDNPTVDTSRFYEAFYFGDSQKLADSLAGLVLAGKKRATASSLWSYEAEGKSPPKAGDLSIVTDWQGTPLCTVETTHIMITPFIEVPAEFAAKEGEGNGSLEDWRSGHKSYFNRECEKLNRSFSESMPVVCEQFRLVHVRDTAGAVQRAAQRDEQPENE